jgi:hypothetical protein
VNTKKDTMNLVDFAKLDNDEKAFKLFGGAKYLQSMMAGQNAITLYYLERFFVEVVIDVAERKILEITGFDRGERLDKYLDKIEVSLYK